MQTLSMVNTVRAAISSGSREKGNYIEVTDIPFPQINDDQILIKTVIFAANPVDWKMHAFGMSKEVNIAGFDASEIVGKGDNNAKDFKGGDYVSTFMHRNSNTKRGAFSE